jgi:hypothetical protein
VRAGGLRQEEALAPYWAWLPTRRMDCGPWREEGCRKGSWADQVLAQRGREVIFFLFFLFFSKPFQKHLKSFSILDPNHSTE